MSLIKRLDPREGFVDFWHEFRRPNPYRWPILAASILMTGTLMFGFMQEGDYIAPERPEVDYITTFADGRTDAEIAASNRENQIFIDEVERQVEEREERKREMFRTLGEVSGMDVDAIEAEAAEERARQAAEDAARLEQAIGNRAAPAGE